MKWLEEDIKVCVDLLKSGKSYDEIGIVLGRTKKSVKLKLNKMGLFITDFNDKVLKIEKDCPVCDIQFLSYKSENRIYCSKSCSVSDTNRKRVKNTNNCINCGNKTRNKYCSHECQWVYNKKLIYEKIESGDSSLYYKNYKKYLIDKFGEKCMNCGWGEKNPTTGKVPIELEHIDGHHQNNNLKNLKLLCPNCHSLTPTYKALNKGNGRFLRVDRKNQGKSY